MIFAALLIQGVQRQTQAPQRQPHGLVEGIGGAVTKKQARLGEAGDDLAAELEGVRLGDLEALQGVVKFPVRIKCATLAWNTLTQGLDEAGAPA